MLSVCLSRDDDGGHAKKYDNRYADHHRLTINNPRSSIFPLCVLIKGAFDKMFDILAYGVRM